jgi:hypothetical protein
MIKDFFRFYITTSCGRIVEKATVDSINTNAELGFAGFTRVYPPPHKSSFLQLGLFEPLRPPNLHPKVHYAKDKTRPFFG